jgi:4-hydroxythreonine-4-phosphate dehydrogenase
MASLVVSPTTTPPLSTFRPRLALVPGEPAGIGPELCVRAAQQAWDADLIAYGDRDTLLRAAEAIGLPLRLISPNDPSAAGPGRLALVEIPQREATVFGTPAPRNARTTIAALETAANACLQGLCDGLVTGPVHKAVINDGGIAYTGTTELLAQQAGCEVVMMLANDIVRMALATTHLPLRAVADAINADALERTLHIVHAALRDDFGIEQPRIAVLGLNPHAGEDGHLGREELDIITPLLQRLRGEGLDLIGPLPADTAFLPAKLREIDTVLAMYHDQGLPVLKYSGFERAVNLTLGLPYPRVAVDHGTALELAGKGTADPSSLFAAIETCAQLARIRAARRAAIADTAEPQA